MKWKRLGTGICGLVLSLVGLRAVSGDGTLPGLKPPGPHSPREELATFRLQPGFRIELVASEPDVIDPVAIAFDEDGRLYVAEMRGYPNEGVGHGNISTGKIKLLEDRDGDGVYEKVTTFAEGLRFPTSIMPWKKGLLVAVAPDIVYMEDSDGDGRADIRRRLYTGFDLANIQQLVNSLQWGLDNWVYGCAGGKGGAITSVEKPDMPVVTLRGRGIRFHPEQPSSLEPMSGGGQFGLAPDDGQHWFTATNSQHLRQIILPDQYLRRNPYLPVSAVTFDIPDHDAACKVHRISPFEAWRVERTQRRKGGPEAKRLPSTELVPGGFITSACSPAVYTANVFPAEYRGNTFVCDPANNLVHRDKLEPKGAIFSAVRADTDHEFLASTDNWFRPVNLTVGPDGALYVVDFYRDVIETPLSLPDDIKKALNMQSRGRGRIWRIVPEGASVRRTPRLREAKSAELVRRLDDANLWWRLTAQRLLVERQDKTVAGDLEQLAGNAKTWQGRAHALWTLHGLHALRDELIVSALANGDAGLREQALRLAEERLTSPSLLAAAVKLANDPAALVRFQLALSLGFSEDRQALAALATVLRRDAADPWVQTAGLSSSAQGAGLLLESLAHDRDFTQGASAAQLRLLTRLASVVGARRDEPELARTLKLLTPGTALRESLQRALLEGLGQGLKNSQTSLSRLWERPPPALKAAIEQTRPYFEQAAKAAQDEQRPLTARLEAVRLLSFGPFATAAPVLQQLLAPQYPVELQLGAVRALSTQEQPRVAEILLAPWNGFSPTVRREVIEALFARSERLQALLNAIEKKQLLAGQLDPFRVDQLRNHRDRRIRERATALLATQATPSRKAIVDEYRSALVLIGNARHGQEVFRKVCSTCHRLENFGTEVGPDLLSALRTKSSEALLVDILDPSREVDPRYLNYIVTTKAGRQFTGLIAVESPSSVTLRRAEKAEDTILRNQIDEIQATAKSVMPEELEKQLGKQDLADVIAYLMAVANPRH